MIAVVVVRDGTVPSGALEAVAEAGGRAVLVGTDAVAATPTFDGIASAVVVVEAGPYAAGGYASGLAPLLVEEDIIVLPGSPDGRDLGPRIAAILDRPFVGNVLFIRGRRATVPRYEGRVQEVLDIDGPFVATLVPGGFGAVADRTGPAVVERRGLSVSGDVGGGAGNGAANAQADAGAQANAGAQNDMVSVSVLPPDPSTMDLIEAPRIVAGGQGLGGHELFDLLGRIGTALGASLGGTRVASDAGWIPFERQIGTTGVAVNPRLYLAFAISGATQHTSGLGAPEHVISVNLDGSCPMMAMADLAIVSDARSVLKELANRLGV